MTRSPWRLSEALPRWQHSRRPNTERAAFLLPFFAEQALARLLLCGAPMRHSLPSVPSPARVVPRRPRRRVLRVLRALVLGGLCAIAVSALGRRAEAATISLNPAFTENPLLLPRIAPDGSVVQKRPLNLTPEGVNYQDCLDNQSIRFPLVLDQFQANASFQAWASAGADCSVQSNRASGTGLCWSLVTGIPLQQFPNVDIPVRKIMSGVLSPTSPDATEAICGKVDLTNIAVQFLYFDPGQVSTPTATKSFVVQVDTVGPPPPTGLTALPGNASITVEWKSISGSGGLTALTGVNAYCDPASTGSDCSNPNFTANTLPDNAFNARFLCGGITGNTGSAVAAKSINGVPLQNGVRYAVAVAGTDAFANVGPLSSPPVCATTDATLPVASDNDGASGGGCSVIGGESPTGSVSLMVVVGMLTAATLRRRLSRQACDATKVGAASRPCRRGTER